MCALQCLPNLLVVAAVIAVLFTNQKSLFGWTNEPFPTFEPGIFTLYYATFMWRTLKIAHQGKNHHAHQTEIHLEPRVYKAWDERTYKPNPGFYVTLDSIFKSYSLCPPPAWLVSVDTLDPLVICWTSVSDICSFSRSWRGLYVWI